ncbi:MAG TPA: hypothetical protein VGY58_02820 [Gemmataceae bacterium]|nr:hypothetical protein [Gemmataceae bacterium]
MAGIDISHWEIWIIPLAGFLSAAVTLFVGRLWFRKPKMAERIPEPKPDVAVPDPFVGGGVHEKRCAFRRGGRLTKVLVSDVTATAPPSIGWVLDRSVSGLGLLLDQAIPEHTILSVRTTDAPDDTPWVQVQVKRCIAKEQQWEIGSTFVRTPAWSVLLLFG